MYLAASLLFLASLPMGLAGQSKDKPGCKKGLNILAQKAGLKYFASATDSPGQRERAGLESAYPQYDQIMWKSGEFHGTTPTNGQKWLFTEPERGVFNYTEGEIVTSLAKKNGFTLRCHNLVWHSQLPDWVTATNWTADELRNIIVDHISHVADHWKGQCYAWDVVNEALNEDGTYRDSVFHQVLGEEYIKLAFETASKVDPHARLYYNDYNIEYPGPKATAAQNIVKMLKKAGIRIDGVGLQGHFVAESQPTIDELIGALEGFTDLGVEAAYTELDVRLTVPATAENLAQQNEGYKNVVGACVQARGCIGVTLWDFYDPFSWVPATFPSQGAPLLWFGNFSQHPAYQGVVEALTNKTGGHGKSRRAELWAA